MNDLIPTALSVRQGDRGYLPNASDIGRHLEVACSGLFLDKVISYDIEEGKVVRFETDPFGNIILNKTRDEAMTETWLGEVVVIRIVKEGQL